MATYAILDNEGVVTNIIVAEPSVIATYYTENNCVEVKEKHFACIGEKFETWENRLARKIATGQVEKPKQPVE